MVSQWKEILPPNMLKDRGNMIKKRKNMNNCMNITYLHIYLPIYLSIYQSQHAKIKSSIMMNKTNEFRGQRRVAERRNINCIKGKFTRTFINNATLKGSVESSTE